MTFTPGQGVWTYTFAAPGLIIEDGAQLLIPLTVLEPKYAELFGDPNTRRSPVAFRSASRVAETVMITQPPGTKVVDVPKNFELEHEYFRVGFQTNVQGDQVILTRWFETRPGIHDLVRFKEAVQILERFDGLRQAAVTLAR